MIIEARSLQIECYGEQYAAAAAPEPGFPCISKNAATGMAIDEIGYLLNQCD